VTDTPLFADALFGLRYWRVTVDDGVEWLAAPHQNTRWPPGGQWLQAKCPMGHDAPAAGCDCGAHAWHPRRRSAREVLAVRATVAGSSVGCCTLITSVPDVVSSTIAVLAGGVIDGRGRFGFVSCIPAP